MKAVISVIGKDKVGILAMIANECANYNLNVLDVSQTIVDSMFTMTMMVAIDKDRKSTRLNSSHVSESRMPSSA